MERRFRVIQGGATGNKTTNEDEGVGPITRLNLWNRTEPVSNKLFAFMIFAKLALLASLLYFIFGR